MSYRRKAACRGAVNSMAQKSSVCVPQQHNLQVLVCSPARLQRVSVACTGAHANADTRRERQQQRVKARRGASHTVGCKDTKWNGIPVHITRAMLPHKSALSAGAPTNVGPYNLSAHTHRSDLEAPHNNSWNDHCTNAVSICYPIIRAPPQFGHLWRCQVLVKGA